MLGRLLEISIGARPSAEAIETYAALGMRSTPVGDIVPGAYAVVTDGCVSIGLQDVDLEGLMPTFVRPDLEKHIRSLENAGAELDLLELGEHQFHRASFRDPSGLTVMLIEARTFPPAATSSHAVPVCGDFIELAVAAHSLDESLEFWTRFGFIEVYGTDTPHPSVRLQGYGLTLGLHETTRFRSALGFRAANLAGRAAYLHAKGFKLRAGSPMTARPADSITLTAPGGVECFLLGGETEMNSDSDAPADTSTGALSSDAASDTTTD